MTPADFEIEGLTFQFCSMDSAHYKNDAMCEMDQQLGDIHGEINDRELEIRQELRVQVLEHAAGLLAISGFVAELDCLAALADAASEYQLVWSVLCSACSMPPDRAALLLLR